MTTRGEKVIAFIETFCKVPQADKVGQPFILEPFQKRFILEIYDNSHGTRNAYLSIARKNGKTSLIAAILLAHIAGPEARRNSQILSGARSREQAGQVFKLARQMVELSPHLSKRVRVVPSSKKLIGLSMNVEYEALAAEATTAYGNSPVLAILDEVGQVRGPRDDFVTAITSSQGAYENPLLIAISTQAPTDNDMFSIWLDNQKNAPDPRVVSHVYAAPEECALDDQDAWYAANPALGKFKALSDIEYKARQAIEMPANESDFRNLDLNQRIETFAPFVTRSVWEKNAGDPGTLDGKVVHGGLDLSEARDLSALVFVDDDGGVHSTFWLPANGLTEKSRKDRVPYDLWNKQGLLNTTPGNAIEYEYVAEHLRGVFDRCTVEAIGFDRYHMNYLRPWLVKAGFSDAELERFKEFKQSYEAMTPALRELEVRLLNGRLKHGNHPVLNMCAANATVEGKSGARKFRKPKDSRRIDGMPALAMAIGMQPIETETEPDYQMFFS